MATWTVVSEGSGCRVGVVTGVVDHSFGSDFHVQCDAGAARKTKSRLTQKTDQYLRTPTKLPADRQSNADSVVLKIEPSK